MSTQGVGAAAKPSTRARLICPRGSPPTAPLQSSSSTRASAAVQQCHIAPRSRRHAIKFACVLHLNANHSIGEQFGQRPGARPAPAAPGGNDWGPKLLTGQNTEYSLYKLQVQMVLPFSSMF